jgi:hypothetical protein
MESTWAQPGDAQQEIHRKTPNYFDRILLFHVCSLAHYIFSPPQQMQGAAQ